MTWLLLAIIGHLLNSVAFIIDKTLLRSSFKQSATYAALMGSISFLAVVAIPWIQVWPSLSLYPSIIAFGGLFVLALWGFFEALKRSEASRVVPIVGSLVPIFTLIETSLFLGERFTGQQFAGFLLLLVATWLLTSVGGKKGKLDRQTIGIAILSAFLFATASAFGKYAFDHGDFLAVLTTSRFAAGIVGVLIGLFVASARKEIQIMVGAGSSRPGHGSQTQGAETAPLRWVVIGQIFGGAGFVLIYIAIAQGSAALVNALQAVQYGAIALVAWFGGKRLRAWLNEERSIRVIVSKSLAIFLIGLGLMMITWPQKQKLNTIYGITWSKPYAESLGINSTEGLRAALDDLHIKNFRIPAYWSEIWIEERLHWEDLDEQLDLIASRQGKVILSIGAKQPRWPEYWIPNWVTPLPKDERERGQLGYVKAVIKRYDHHPAVIAWQVENESQFPFGTGDEQSPEFVQQEMQLVRSLSTHPIYTTDSGELSTWLDFRHDIDRLGISVYRVVKNRYIGIWHYWFLPPWFYTAKATLISPWIKPVYVSEFQMEPWAETPLHITPLDQQFKTFNLAQMQSNFSYAQKMNMPSIYFWGAEWWYWMKIKMNHPEFWEQAKKVNIFH
ncbi:hypothetical protein EXS71_02845 [Candidatus Uhrbacteria bacterium]|nr:hypothetical protein [Candidatus Uhrbacteria bacterium]